MKESTLRKIHRSFGISIALLIILQAGTGLLLSLAHLTGIVVGGEVIHGIHFGDGGAADAYRVLLAAAILVLAATGVWIFVKIRIRAAAAGKRTA